MNNLASDGTAATPALDTDPQSGLRQSAAFLSELFAGLDRGTVVLFSIPDNRSKFFDVADPSWAVSAAHTAMAMRPTQHTYMSVCALTDRPQTGRGTESDVYAVPGMWADIDVRGSAHKSKNLPPTFEDAQRIIATVPFPATVIVNSGHGLQAYWLFKEPTIITSDDERGCAKGLASAFSAYLQLQAKHLGWSIDPVGDLARVLRLPGTFNRKIQDDIRFVSYTETEGKPRYNPSDFEEFLEYEDDPELQRLSTQQTSRNGHTATRSGEIQADFALIAQGCAWLNHCIADAATLPEPEWYRALAIAARTENGRQIAHEISRDYPKYTPGETNAKFDQSLSRSRAPRCSTLSQFGHCSDCQYRGRINSPVKLGFRAKQVPPQNGLVLIDSPVPPPAGYHALDALLARNDIPAIFRMAPEFAKLAVTEWQITRATLVKNFGKDLGAKGLDAAVKAERYKLRKEARDSAVLPQIIVTDRPVRDLTAEALQALHAWNNPPTLFLRSGELVRVISDEQGRPMVQPVNESCLRGLMTRSADYLKATPDGDKHVPPPIEIVRDLANLSPEVLAFPRLSGIAEVPTLRPDGTILDTPGYDAQTGLVYSPPADLKMPEVPNEPMLDDVEAALGLIDEAIGDFPFEDDASRANLLGLLLTAVVRPALDGCTPLALIDAPQAGTGKSLLANLFSMIATGRPAAMMPYPKNDEEMQKQIGSCLMASRPLVCFDNLEGNLSSPALALALTAREYEARILGTNQNMLVPNNATWLITGNNIRPAGDMPRRCYHIRLNAKRSRPFTGRKFRHADLIGWATQARARLLHALLTITRYWYVSGRPQFVSDPLGSFEAWHRLIGSVLRQAGVSGFLGNLDSFLAQADETVAEWEMFLTQLKDYFAESRFTAASVVDAIENSVELKKSVPLALAEKMAAAKAPSGAQRAIGLAFAKTRGVRYGDTEIYIHRLEQTHVKMAEWCVLVGEEIAKLASVP